MKKTSPLPLICVTANAMESAERRRPLHATGVRNVLSLLKMVPCMPVMLPPVGTAVDIVELVSRMDGFVLPGGRATGVATPAMEQTTQDRLWTSSVSPLVSGAYGVS